MLKKPPSNKSINIFIVFLPLVFIFNIGQIQAHAEHDKVRYVSSSLGKDTGRCDEKSQPCKTINYAVVHANKGDQIHLSSGSYHIENADTLFYLLSDLVPIIANYQTDDNFGKRNLTNITYLTGVPTQYVQKISAKGFTVIVDNKAGSAQNIDTITKKLNVYSRLKNKQQNTTCNNNLAGDYPCNNMDLLAHVPLNQFSTTPSKANDIWGHYDLNDNNEYAIIGLNNGIGIVDITTPSSPRIVTTIASADTSWRDIKVYQYFDISINKWQSYAYITADNATVGLLILDLNQLPATVTIAATDKTNLSAHNVYLSNVDYSTGVALTGKTPYLHIAGSNNNGGGFNSYSLESPTDLVSIYQPSNDRSQYSHDLSSMTITDERKETQCINGKNHCEIMFDFNENDFQLWDKTNNEQPEKLSTTRYENASYVHSGWYSENKLLMLVHDELDEQDMGLNTTLRLFDISNLKNPSLLSIWSGTTRAIDHNGYVRGNRYYMSNYERGITVLDITDPTLPSEVGYFDTYPLSDNAAFHGAWGVYPFLPSGHIIASDINSGLYIIKDNTLDSPQGSLHFASNHYTTSEGQTVEVIVSRNGQTSGAINVNWELVSGSADIADFTLASNSLQWSDGDTSDKKIMIDITSDNIAEPDELLFIRLFDPQNGATLNAPNIATITIAASNGINIPTVTVGNNLSVNAGSLVNLVATVNDIDNDSLSYLWQQTSGKVVTITNSDQLNASFTAPQGNEVLSFNFTVTDATGLSASDALSVAVSIEIIVVTPEKKSSGGGSISLFLLFLMAIRMIYYHLHLIKQQVSKSS